MLKFLFSRYYWCMKMYLIPILACLIGTSCMAQKETYTTSNKKAIKLFESGKEYFIIGALEDARQNLLKALALDSNFAEAHVYLGETYFMANLYQEAAREYAKGVSLAPEKMVRAYRPLASLHEILMQYGESIQAYTDYLTYKEKVREDDRLFVENEIARLTILKNLFENPVPFNPVNLGPNINSDRDEYHPALPVDESMILYTVVIPGRGGCRTSTGAEEDFFISYRDSNGWQPRANLGSPINTYCNEGAGALSPDGTKLFFASVTREEDNPDKSQDLYVSTRSNKSWGNPVPLSYAINSRFFDSQPSFSADGKTLYFTSKRSGGYGDGDIYTSQLLANGAWSEPVNLGTQINTSGDDISPFIHPDGKTLYFASSGHPGFGGTDFFYSRKQDDGSWSTPVNLGYPINSTDHERSLIINAAGTKGYFASKREGGYGGYDLYVFDLYEEARPLIVTYLKGKTYDGKTLQNLGAKFELIDLETSEVTVQSISDNTTGEFLLTLPQNHNFALNVSKNGYLFYTQNIHVSETNTAADPLLLDIPLEPIALNGKIVLNNVFFDTDLFNLKPESYVELNKLVATLNENPTVKIEIGGHTDNQGTKQHNLELSKNRATAVYNYLVSQGIDANRLSYKGYGDTLPVGDNSTEKGRAENRRTEIKITGL